MTEREKKMSDSEKVRIIKTFKKFLVKAPNYFGKCLKEL